MNDIKTLNTIELFAGAGGLIEGFEKSGGYDVKAAVEWLTPQCRTLSKNIGRRSKGISKAEILNFDIQRTEELLYGWDDEIYGSNRGLVNILGDSDVDIITGGPPCQAYSLAGRIRDKSGMKLDYRNFLFEAYIKIVEKFRPKIVVFENVEGLLSAIPTGELIVDLIRAAFNNAGYEIIADLRKDALQDLSEYGIPQRRKRLIIVGIRRDKDNVSYQELLKFFYRSILNEKKEEKRKTVKDAIGDLPVIEPLEKNIGKISHENSSSINGHCSRFHNDRDKEIFELLARDITNGTMKYTSAKELIQLYFEKTGKQTNVHKYHVLRWDEPSNTIPAHLKKDGLRHIHPDANQKRSITVREAARLQTFPDDFIFSESMGANFEMIGNAVPPKFAQILADSIKELFNKIKKVELKE